MQASVEPCADPPGCKRFDRSGSNAWISRKTCFDCGSVFARRREQTTVYVDPATCSHSRLSYAGSTRTVHKVTCRDCGTTIDEEPQTVWKARLAENERLNKSGLPSSSSGRPTPVRPDMEVSEQGLMQIMSMTGKMALKKALADSQSRI